MNKYTTAQKADYRAVFWSVVDKFCKVPKAKRVVAVLEDKGLEAVELLRNGYTPSNITMINMSSAVLAHCTMHLDRERLPRVNVATGEFTKVVARDLDKFDVINFDSCDAVSDKTLRRIQRLTTGCKSGGLIGLNLVSAHTLKDYESRSIRVKSFASLCGLRLLHRGRYTNPVGAGNTSMMWFLLRKP